jgi:hypothetical protein
VCEGVAQRDDKGRVQQQYKNDDKCTRLRAHFAVPHMVCVCGDEDNGCDTDRDTYWLTEILSLC